MKNILFGLTRVSLFLFITLFFLAVEAKTYEGKINTYSITINQKDKFTASVKAKISVEDNLLSMHQFGAKWKHKEGWAKFVKRLKVLDSSGKNLDTKPLENAKWEIIDKHSGEVILNYEIDFKFALEKWETGNEQAAYFEDDTLFTVTKVLFITSKETNQSVVSFNLPKNWKITTPWNSVARNSNKFQVKSLDELINNSIVIGKQGVYSYKQDDFVYRLAQIGSMKQSEELMAEVMKKQLNAYKELFGGLPKTNYLQVIFKGPEDGEAYTSSSAFTTDLKPARHNIILWGNTLGHELFHKWNGINNLIAAQDRPTSAWFAEGFTEYYSNVMLLRTGLIDKATFIKKMEKHLGMYLFYNWSRAFNDSIKDSGKRKGFNRPGVYSGGWAVAFTLDVLIRNKTQNRKSLDDFMKLIYQEFGVSDKKYSFEDIVRIASDTAGEDLTPFFKNFVEGKKRLPVAEFLRKSGFEAGLKPYGGEVYLWRNPKATELENTIRRTLLFGK